MGFKIYFLPSLIGRVWREMVAALCSIGNVLYLNTRIDRVVAPFLIIFVTFIALSLTKTADNPRMLASSVDDEPLITMQLEGMTVWPIGNPANFLDKQRSVSIPEHWSDLRYWGIIYYGGAYLAQAFFIFAPLKWLGAPTFPLAPILLRLFSGLWGLVGLLLIYNLAKRYGDRKAGAVAATLLISDYFLIYFSTVVHPDSMMFAFAVIGLFLALEHAKDGALSSFLGLSIVVGVMHGIKSGAPWMLPLSLVACYWGCRAKHVENLVRNFVVRFFYLTIVSIFTFFVTTPYALFDRYYFTTMFKGLRYITSDPNHMSVTIGSWLKDLFHYISAPISLMIILSIVYLLMTRRRFLLLPMLFCFILAGSNLLWYAALGRLWVQIFYYIPAYGVLACILGWTCSDICGRLSTLKNGAILGGFLIVFVLTTLVTSEGRGFSTVQYVLQNYFWRESSEMAVNKWAQENILPNSRVMHDASAYFDPTVYPHQSATSAFMNYHLIAKFRPEYIVIADRNDKFMRRLRKTQNLERWNTDPYSVTVYQDLIPKPPMELELGSTNVRGIDLVHVIHTEPEKRLWKRVLWGLCPNFCGHENLYHRLTLLIYKIDHEFYSGMPRI